MADFSKIIEEKASSARYMAEEITHICRDMPKRDPGSEGEKIACEYMADVLKNQCGCEKVVLEDYKEHPNAFFGWIYITATCALIADVLYFFMPILAAIIVAFGFFVMTIQFVFYKKAVDFLFPEKTGHNVTAIKKCTGEVKARVMFNGHPDAVWNWPVNNRFGGKVYEAHIALAVVGGLLELVFAVITTVLLALKSGKFVTIITPSQTLPFILGIVGVAFAPFLFLLYFMWDEKTIVDGANDNLTGCYMGIAILKAMRDQGIELEHTEVGVILSGGEEAGLRGSKAWCEKHKGEFDDVPTWIYSYDTIHDSKYLAVNYYDLNGTVRTDKEVGDSFMESAKELGIPCKKSGVPPFGGATDSAAFAQAGYKVTGITALNHVLEDYYHTLKDTYTNLDEKCLADCFAISVNCLKKMDEKTKEIK